MLMIEGPIKGLGDNPLSNVPWYCAALGPGASVIPTCAQALLSLGGQVDTTSLNNTPVIGSLLAAGTPVTGDTISSDTPLAPFSSFSNTLFWAALIGVTFMVIR